MLAYNCKSYKEGKNTNNEMMKRLKSNVVIALFPWLGQLAFLYNPGPPKGDTAHSVPDPSTSITNQENTQVLSTYGIVLQ